jgi:hypothetical protein
VNEDDEDKNNAFLSQRPAIKKSKPVIQDYLTITPNNEKQTAKDESLDDLLQLSEKGK